jgi:hypothetical protein
MSSAWPALLARGYTLGLTADGMTLRKDGKTVLIPDLPPRVCLRDYLHVLMSHWDSVVVERDGCITCIAGVHIRDGSASVDYCGRHVEYEISPDWGDKNLEEVVFFVDMLPNYLNGVEIPHGGVVFDLGSYHGLFAIAASLHVGPEGSVYCFEPDPANLNVLQRNLSEMACRTSR